MNSAARVVLQRAIAKLYVLMLTDPAKAAPCHVVSSDCVGRWVNLLMPGALMRNTCYWKQLELAYVQVVHSQIAATFERTRAVQLQQVPKQQGAT